MNAKITLQQRKAILAFKKMRDDSDIDFCSQRIYDLVLKKGMTSRIVFTLLLVREFCKR